MPKKKKIIPYEEGTCPVCGGLDLDYSDPYLEDASAGYEWACPDCNSTGVEWHSLTFSCHVARSVWGKDKIKCFDPDKQAKPDKDAVIIEVYRGCASVASKPEGVRVIIRDLD
jgi:RNA polymerase subunit RPABC4/transcription elongation factor Spt4